MVKKMWSVIRALVSVSARILYPVNRELRAEQITVNINAENSELRENSPSRKRT